MSKSFDDISFVKEAKHPVKDVHALINYFQIQAKKFSENIYIRYEIEVNDSIQVETLTYEQVDRISTNLACKLHETMGDKATIALMEDHSVTYLVLLIALYKLRIPVLLISVRNSPEAVCNLLGQVNADAFIYGSSFSHIKDRIKAEYPNTECASVPELNLNELKQVPLNISYNTILDQNFTSEDEDKTNIIVHSSGTTSMPKAIRWSNRFHLYTVQVYEYAFIKRNQPEYIGDSDDILMAITPLVHMFGQIGNFQTAMHGSSIYYTKQFPPSSKDVIKIMKKEKITRLNAPPYFINQMLHYMQETGDVQLFQKLKWILSGGAPTPKSQDEYFKKNKFHFGTLYGMSECCYMMFSEVSPNRTDSNTYFLLPDAEKHLDMEPYDGDRFQPVIKYGSPFRATDIACRENGDFATKDLFIPSKTDKGGYYYAGRADDILIMSTGENTNPLPMEDVIKSNPLVSHCTVIGEGRLCTAAIIQLNTEVVQNTRLDEVVKSVHETIKIANESAPSHSTILPEMVMLLPLSKQLPATDKGTISRKRSIALFQKEVDSMYNNLISRKTKIRKIDNNNNNNNEQTIEFKVLDVASKVLNPKTPLDNNYSLFKQGLNSILAIQFVNFLSENIQPVPQNFLYQYSTITDIINFFSKEDKSTKEGLSTLDEEYQNTSNVLNKYLKLASKELVYADVTNYNSGNDDEEHVVLLTGATGSLGTMILLNLLSNHKIKKVYTLVREREGTDLMSRINESLKKRGYTELVNNGRVEALPMCLEKENLGFSTELYNKLKTEVTMVQHCAWLMDFNQPVSFYDAECLRGLYNLIKFSNRRVNPIHLHFISSISATATYGGTVPESPMLADPRVAMPMGYAQSKFIAEQLFHFLVERKNMPCYIHRIAQLCGDSKSGSWNVSEMYPLTIIGGGSIMKKMPDLSTVVDWLPIDIAGDAIANIMMNTANKSISKAHEGIFHIVNPKCISWSDVLASMKSCGMKFDVISAAAWLEELALNQDNVAYKLLPFYKNSFQNNEGASVKWATENTCNVAPILQNTSTFQDNFSKYLKYWEKIGFYNSNQ